MRNLILTAQQENIFKLFWQNANACHIAQGFHKRFNIHHDSHNFSNNTSVQYTTYNIHYFQEPLCSTKKLKCVNKITVNHSSCMKPCSGLIVTSFIKSEKHKNLELLYPKIFRQYEHFKKISTGKTGQDKVSQVPLLNNTKIDK